MSVAASLILAPMACELPGRIEPLTPEQASALQAAFDQDSIPNVDAFGYAVDTLDRRVLTRWLRQGKYDSLTANLAERWRLTREDITNEGLLYNGFEAFYQGSGVLEDQLRSWAAAQPTAAEPHLAQAYYRYGRAYEARGGRSAATTAESQFAEMQRQIALGREAADAGLRLAPDHLIGHFVRIQFLRLGGASQDAATRTVQGAIVAHPASFLIRDEIMTLLQPRWGGNLDVMRAFANASREFIPRNRKLAVLQGRVPMDEARTGQREFGMALALLDQAAFHGEDYHLALAYGALYASNGMLVDAFEAYRRARAFIPQGRSQVMQGGVVMMRLAVLAESGPLRDSLFVGAERALRFAATMQIPNEDPETYLAWLAAARDQCVGEAPPCASVW